MQMRLAHLAAIWRRCIQSKHIFPPCCLAASSRYGMEGHLLPTCGHRALAASKSRVGRPSRQLAGSEPVAAPGRRQKWSNSLLGTAALRHTPPMNTNASGLFSRKAFANPRTLRSVFSQGFAAKKRQSTSPLPTPNPSIKRTCLRQAAYVKR